MPAPVPPSPRPSGDGLRNAEIADLLVLSQRTVEHHVASILRKLRLANQAEAGRHARRHGIPSPADAAV